MRTKKKILYIIPVAADPQRIEGVQDRLNKIKDVDTEVEVIGLENGPKDLEYQLYEHIAVDRILDILLGLEQSYDSIVIACFYDPGSKEIRELVDMPVVFPGEACMHVAAMLGHKFSIIVGRRNWFPPILDNVKLYGLESRLASIRAINMPTADLHSNPEEAIKRLSQECQKAIEEDFAEVVILGCAVLVGIAEDIQNQLGVPILDPVMVPYKVAELFAALKVTLGLSHSKKYLGKLELGYAFPHQKELKRLKGWK